MGKTELQLYGAGGHGRVVADAWLSSGGKIARVVDDNPSAEKFNDHQVFLPSHLDRAVDVFVAIGSNLSRKHVVEKLGLFTFGTVVHRNTIVATSASIGNGTLIMPGAIINSGAVIGLHCIINTGAIVEHDVHMEDYVHAAPGSVICGASYIGEGTLLGASTCVIPGVRIGRSCVIGAGSVVIRDLPDFSVAVGNPARVIRKNIG